MGGIEQAFRIVPQNTLDHKSYPMVCNIGLISSDGLFFSSPDSARGVEGESLEENRG